MLVNERFPLHCVVSKETIQILHPVSSYCMDMTWVRTGKNILWPLLSLAHLEIIIAGLTKAKQDHMNAPHLRDCHSYWLENF